MSCSLHVAGEAAPQHLHDAAAAILGIDARAAELDHLARLLQQRRKVEFLGGIEAVVGDGDRSPQQPVGADDADGAVALVAVDHQQMVADRIEGIGVAPRRTHLRRRTSRHLVVEDPIAQRLRRVDFFR